MDEEPQIDPLDEVRVKKTVGKRKGKATKAATKAAVSESSSKLKVDGAKFLSNLPKQPTGNRHVKYVVHEVDKKEDGSNSIIMPTKTVAVKFTSAFMPKYGGLTIQRYSKSKTTGNVSIGHKKREVTNTTPSAHQQFVADSWKGEKFLEKFRKEKADLGVKTAMGKASKRIASAWNDLKADGKVQNKGPSKPKGNGSSLGLKEQYAIAKKNPSAYRKINKKGEEKWDVAKVRKITK